MAIHRDDIVVRPGVEGEDQQLERRLSRTPGAVGHIKRHRRRGVPRWLASRRLRMLANRAIVRVATTPIGLIVVAVVGGIITVRIIGDKSFAALGEDLAQEMGMGPREMASNYARNQIVTNRFLMRQLDRYTAVSGGKLPPVIEEMFEMAFRNRLPVEQGLQKMRSDPRLNFAAPGVDALLFKVQRWLRSDETTYKKFEGDVNTEKQARDWYQKFILDPLAEPGALDK